MSMATLSPKRNLKILNLMSHFKCPTLKQMIKSVCQIQLNHFLLFHFSNILISLYIFSIKNMAVHDWRTYIYKENHKLKQ